MRGVRPAKENEKPNKKNRLKQSKYYDHPNTKRSDPMDPTIEAYEEMDKILKSKELAETVKGM